MNHLMDEKQIHRRCIPRLATELYKVMDNKEKWREEAEHLFELDVEVARDLLTEYSQTTYDDFIRIARQLWQAGRFRQELASFMFENIDREQSPEFYKDVLIWLTSSGRSISRYKQLRTILADQEKEEFIQSHKRNICFIPGCFSRNNGMIRFCNSSNVTAIRGTSIKCRPPFLNPIPKKVSEFWNKKYCRHLRPNAEDAYIGTLWNGYGWQNA